MVVSESLKHHPKKLQALSDHPVSFIRGVNRTQITEIFSVSVEFFVFLDATLMEMPANKQGVVLFYLYYLNGFMFFSSNPRNRYGTEIAHFVSD